MNLTLKIQGAGLNLGLVDYQSRSFSSFRMLCMLAILCGHAMASSAMALVQPKLTEQVKQAKQSVVAIALLTPIESNAPKILGTGFVVGDGKHIVTNYHVVSQELDAQIVQYFVALSGEGRRPQVHKMTMIGIDPVHDLALLSIDQALTPLQLASDSLVEAGTSLYMVGFPIGAVLGLYPAVHTGVLSAVTPDANPARNANELTIKMMKRLTEPFMIYQLDMTAFPGNSGSPVFSRDTSEVVGILNKVFVSEGKESALTNPSGISYAIPVQKLKKLAKANNVTL